MWDLFNENLLHEGGEQTIVERPFLKMKTAATLLTLAAGASAFTSTQPTSRSTAVNAVMDKWTGSIDLRGREFKFDPVRTSEWTLSGGSRSFP